MATVSTFEISYEPLIPLPAGRAGGTLLRRRPPFVEGYFLQITNAGEAVALELRFTTDAAALLTGSDRYGAAFVSAGISMRGGGPRLGALTLALGAPAGVALLPPLAPGETLLFGLIPNPACDLAPAGGMIDIRGQVEISLAAGAALSSRLVVLPQSRILFLNSPADLGETAFALEYGGGTLLCLHG